MNEKYNAKPIYHFLSFECQHIFRFVPKNSREVLESGNFAQSIKGSSAYLLYVN